MDFNRLDEGTREKLDDFEFQYGPLAGKLALAMDLLSDAQIAAGQLAVYCRNSMQPGRPHPDVVVLQQNIEVVRTVVKGAFREERTRKAQGGSGESLIKPD
ncbi:hypothetical protein IT570_10365 [Candidatus Sumerlaeota bacterium]|nr:hypothetical protein [Candidatus Sumerlaeota bacterium]